MGSLFINAGLAAGVALAAVPVILHLFMKQTPKHVIFPALRLIKERQKRSRKKLRVKNWLLLLARMALLALMALALARPRVDARANLGMGDSPAAIALVFDTSLSMGYKELDKRRLEEAKERAREVLNKANEQSKVFVIDSADPGPPVASTPAAARKRIDGLEVRAANRSLNGAVGAAYAAVAGADLSRREVFVLTDLAASQWQTGQEVEGLAQATKSLKSGRIDTFLLRVGPKEVRDVAIVSADPAAPIATEGDPVILKVKLRNVGAKANKRIVEYYVDDLPDPRDKKAVDIPAASEVDVPPWISTKLDVGLHRITVRISGAPDPLEFDDARFLTVDVQPAIKVLLITDLSVNTRAGGKVYPDAQFVANVLDPPRESGGPLASESLPRPFQVTQVLTTELDRMEGRPLREFAAVFVLNVKALDPSWWSKLWQYVTREGGGLVVAPGGLADVGNYNRGQAAELLPGRLGAPVTHPPGNALFSFGKPDLGHPIFERNQKELIGELARVPVYKSWSVEAPGRVILRYADDSPALLEKTFGGQRPGKVLLWTTPLARRPDPRDPEGWNEFPDPLVGWGFLAVMEQTVFYLSGASGQKLAVESGEDAVLSYDPARALGSFSVLGPNGKPGDRDAEPVAGGLVLVPAPDALGHWEVTGRTKEGNKKVSMGFSVNPPRSELQTTPLSTGDLDALFGKGKYQLADDAASLKRTIDQTVYGREIFPWVMALILLIVTLENLLANTFYREKTAAVPLARAAA